MKFKIIRFILQGLGLLFLLAVTVYILSRWQSVPAEIPARFDAAGNPSSFAPRSTLVSLLVISWVGYLLFTVLSYFPKAWNLPVKTPRAYRIAGILMPVLGLMIALIFGWVSICSATGRSLGAWFLPATLAAIGVPTLILIVGSFRE
ncbi:MAG: DUF1648 domain-containing protein [Oscillospiraceae bacterium]|nr:DUF1648 domain-containing protein [Oscillospiraceae bacterium]